MAYDLLIRNGSVHDGSGSTPINTDVAVAGDRIVRVGVVPAHEAAIVLDASGLAVAPGFINMLSHSYSSILQDPRSLGELKQGVTTQIFGEAYSMGPWTEEMRAHHIQGLRDAPYDVPWLRLSEYLSHVEKIGSSQNVASYIGATTLRVHAVGYGDRPATPQELDLMRNLVAEEMADGALGIGSALIYPPGFFASTDELVELCRASAPWGGRYISHMRSEGNELLEGIGELLEISRRAEVPAEIYHLKAAGRRNWPKMDKAIEMVEDARSRGEPIGADVYTYTAGATSLAASIPPRFHDGGIERLRERLEDPAVRADIRTAIESTEDGWENLYSASGGAEGVLLLSVEEPSLKPYQGRTLAEVAAAEGADPIETLIDLVRRDPSRIGAAYFIISEDNLRKQIALPWVSVGSDAASQAAEGRFIEKSTHPRSYGTFARFLGRYVREEGVITLPEAIRRMTSLPADNLGLRDRGRVVEGGFADLVVFDPATIADRATYQEPHRYADGVHHVVVNGRLTIRDGEHTGTFAGRALRPATTAVGAVSD